MNVAVKSRHVRAFERDLMGWLGHFAMVVSARSSLGDETLFSAPEDFLEVTKIEFTRLSSGPSSTTLYRNR